MISRLTLFSNGVDRIAKNSEFHKNSNPNTSQIKKTIKVLIQKFNFFDQPLFRKPTSKFCTPSELAICETLRIDSK